MAYLNLTGARPTDASFKCADHNLIAPTPRFFDDIPAVLSAMEHGADIDQEGGNRSATATVSGGNETFVQYLLKSYEKVVETDKRFFIQLHNLPGDVKCKLFDKHFVDECGGVYQVWVNWEEYGALVSGRVQFTTLLLPANFGIVAEAAMGCKDRWTKIWHDDNVGDDHGPHGTVIGRKETFIECLLKSFERAVEPNKRFFIQLHNLPGKVNCRLFNRHFVDACGGGYQVWVNWQEYGALVSGGVQFITLLLPSNFEIVAEAVMR
jgi:hypothetical protein